MDYQNANSNIITDVNFLLIPNVQIRMGVPSNAGHLGVKVVVGQHFVYRFKSAGV